MTAKSVTVSTFDPDDPRVHWGCSAELEEVKHAAEVLVTTSGFLTDVEEPMCSEHAAGFVRDKL